MEFTICALPGDGIGPEITEQALGALSAVADTFHHSMQVSYADIGGRAIDLLQTPLPEQTLEECKKADAVFLGAVGGPKWDDLPAQMRPEKGLLGLRKELGLFANLRPAFIYPELQGASCLKPETIGSGIDLLVIRELTGGIYFGEPRGREDRQGQEVALNTMVYSVSEIERIARVGFQTAAKRRGRLCSVDKANVLEVSQLWREVVTRVGRDEYPDIELSHMYVDNAAMQLVQDPGQFDVILTGNLFGDILSDEAAIITGSIGLLSSASLGMANPGLFEPIHGSAPDIAGRDLANPLAAILSVAMLLRYSLGLEEEARSIEQAVKGVLAQGQRTADLVRGQEPFLGPRSRASLRTETRCIGQKRHRQEHFAAHPGRTGGAG
ncbi:MAG: 3-isopropylmalate dehydrogenase [Desulfohalobiaceae bacterium]